ncbi:MAG: nicotinate phosphoribosyltransferase [Flammeovirgaceae bacterium]
MKLTKDIYQTPLTLLTDLYQVTMAYGYWKSGTTEKDAVFNLYFRKNPFQGGYTVAAGLEYVVDFLQNLKFGEEDLAFLAGLTGNDGKPLFEQGFLDYLRDMEFSCDIDAVPEGTVVFPNEPLLRVKGPLFQCQLIETPLLTMINFQTLIATKAARLVMAADGDPVLEFGMRRAQGIDGALAASRAAYIGGCTATSNILAGKLFNIPVKGTHAHSWVMSFDSEMEAFETYAAAMPNNCIFLVDTYNTLEGVKKAIDVGKKLRDQGYEMAGIRLDSGDLAYLSIEARKLLDASGFEKARIVASNDLNELIINSLKNEQHAKIDVWGVGTKLATAYDQPALGGVYKISAIKNAEGEWDYKVKLSEQAIKVSNPGVLQVKRYYYEDGSAMADMIYDEDHMPEGDVVIVDPLDITRRKTVSREMNSKGLLQPIFKAGKLIYDLPDIEEIRSLVHQELQSFHPSIKRFTNPHGYPVGLEKNLYELKNDLIMKLRGNQ